MRFLIYGIALPGFLIPDDCLANELAQPVNFLIITADDVNWDSVGCYGCPLKNVTPTIDRLARQGVRFEHAHVASTACYPSRSAISTGRGQGQIACENFSMSYPPIESR